MTKNKKWILLGLGTVAVATVLPITVVACSSNTSTTVMTQDQVNSFAKVSPTAISGNSLPAAVTDKSTTNDTIVNSLATKGITLTLGSTPDGVSPFVISSYTIAAVPNSTTSISITITGTSGGTSLTTTAVVVSGFNVNTSLNFNKMIRIVNPSNSNITITPAGATTPPTAGPLFNLKGIPVQVIRNIATSDGSGNSAAANNIYTSPSGTKGGIIANIDFAFFQQYLSGTIDGTPITTSAQFNQLENFVTWDLWSLSQFAAGTQNAVATPVTSFSALNGPSAWVILPNIKEGATKAQLTQFETANATSSDQKPAVSGAGNILGGGRVWTQNDITLTPNTSNLTLSATDLQNLFEESNNLLILKSSSITNANLFSWFSSIVLNGETFTTNKPLSSEDLTDLFRSLNFELYNETSNTPVTSLTSVIAGTYHIMITNKTNNTITNISLKSPTITVQ